MSSRFLFSASTLVAMILEIAEKYLEVAKWDSVGKVQGSISNVCYGT